MALRQQRYGRRRPSREPKATTKSVPAPVGGWNARDSVDDMEENEAVQLDNWFPGQGEVVLRRGHTSHATTMGGVVETIAEFNAGSTRHMIGAANGKLWNATAAGAATQLGTGFANNRWQWAQFDDSSGGARLGLVNGADTPKMWNGTSLADLTITGSGLTSTTLNGINVFKNRSYFWATNTQDFWYSAANALGGACTKFPLGRVAGTGGNLIAMGTWTRDGGAGPDDFAVFLLSSGDVVIYAGTNPGDAAAWQLVGIYKIGAPLGVRGLVKIGADLLVITVDGYHPLSKILADERVNDKNALSDKIRKAVLAATREYSANFGWQAIHYPLGNMAIFNVPLSSSIFNQHVVNTQTGAWCKFTGMNARTWGMFNDRLYFGGSGVIYKADNGTADNSAAINASAQTAWTYLGSREKQKKFVNMRPLLRTNGATVFNVGIGVDFGKIMVSPTESQGATVVTPWGSPWGSPWSGEDIIAPDWLGADGIGHNVSARIDVVTALRSVSWYSTQYRYELGRGGY